MNPGNSNPRGSGKSDLLGVVPGASIVGDEAPGGVGVAALGGRDHSRPVARREARPDQGGEVDAHGADVIAAGDLDGNKPVAAVTHRAGPWSCPVCARGGRHELSEKVGATGVIGDPGIKTLIASGGRLDRPRDPSEPMQLISDYAHGCRAMLDLTAKIGG